MSQRKHRVSLLMTSEEIQKAYSAIRLEIFESGLKLGTLEIGRGAVYWKKARGRRKRIDWSRFAAIMTEKA